MHLGEWSKSNTDYGRKLVNSGLQGARSGREAFLQETPLAPYLGDSARHAWKPAAIGACVGVLGGSCPFSRNKSVGRTIVYGLLGGLLGFGAGLLWESRSLTASVASGAMRNMERVRDEHWLAKHPIDYA